MILGAIGISKSFKNQLIVDNIDLQFKSGELIGLIGKNGSGKSTLIKMLTTALKPTAGDILFDGKSVLKRPEKLRRELGYLPQDFPIYANLTVMEFLLFMVSIKNIDIKMAKEHMHTYLNQLHLEGSQNAKLMELSGGMLQKVGIINAIIGNPKLIILDEPANGLDPSERNNLRNLLVTLAKNSIIIYSTHIIGDVEQVASRIVVMEGGKVAFDGTDKSLISSVKGKVWEFYTENKGAVGNENNYFIINMKSVENGLKLRVVSPGAPHPNAVEVNETLEDAYLYSLSEKAVINGDR